MFDFNKPKIEIAEISEDKKYGRFVVEPLERGYGTTLGNSLRRIMLSSLPGAAVSQVKIEGVLHEFSSIPGVKEDVTEIIMNIKSLAIQNNSETDEPKVAYIEYEGEGVVTAADIKADSDIVIMNPDQVIAQGVIYLKLISLMYVMPGITNGIQGFFRGMGEMKVTLLSSTVNIATRCIGAAILIFGFGMHIEAVPWGQFIGWVCMLIVEVPILLRWWKKL